MIRTTTRIILLVGVMIKGAEATPFVAIDGEFNQGKYGSDITSSIYQLTATFGSISSTSDASVSVSWLRLSNDDNLSVASIGDTYLRGGYELAYFNNQDISLYGSVSVKIPTADENKGLGTGEVDYGALLAVKKRWANLNGMIYGGYTIIGDPNDIEYINSTTYGASIISRFDRIGTYLGLEGSSAIVEDYKNPLQLNIGAIYAVSFQNLVYAGGAFGLSDGSPELEFNLGISHLF